MECELRGLKIELYNPHHRSTIRIIMTIAVSLPLSHANMRANGARIGVTRVRL